MHAQPNNCEALWPAAKPAGSLRILADRLCLVIFAMAAWYLLIELIWTGAAWPT